MTNTRDHKRFCDNDGWELYRQTDHYFYRKTLPSGEVLKTKVSMGNVQYSPKVWADIRKKQLRVTQTEFNDKI